MKGNFRGLRTTFFIIAAVLVVAMGCSDDEVSGNDGELDAGTDDVAVEEDAPPSGEEDASTGEGDVDSQDDDADADPNAAQGDVDEVSQEDASTDEDTGPQDELHFGTCFDDPPDGVQLAPDPKPYSQGQCPELEAGFNILEYEDPDCLGGQWNPMCDDDWEREFMLVVPEDLQADEHLPVIFLWHWLGGSAQRFYERGEIQKAVDTQRFLAVIPEEKGDLQFRWPYSREVEWNPDRIEEEAVFFDDVLACISEQYNVNNNCVASAGVSAGALWTAQLMMRRGEYLSSFLSLSGGVGEDEDGLSTETILPWIGSDKQVPGIVLWGGEDDWCIVDFHEASLRLEDALVEDGHFFVECIHNCEHSKPPMEAEDGLSRFAGLWEFVFDHPYWVTGGTSPYQQQGLPDSTPDWCGIGPDGATIREGECEPHSCQ